MTTRWERFAGNEATFALRLAFHSDPDDGQGSDADTAASWGALQVWVDGINLCAHNDQGESLQWCHWYMLPVLEWLAQSWDPLLHEERLPASTRQFATASELLTASPPVLFGNAARSPAPRKQSSKQLEATASSDHRRLQSLSTRCSRKRSRGWPLSGLGRSA